MSGSRTSSASAVVLAVLISASTPMWTAGVGRQSTVGTLAGVVMDESRAVIPGVTVKVRNEDNGVAQSTLTNDSGQYSFLLAPGPNYTVTAELAGFKKQQITQIVVRIADTLRVDIVLQVGDVKQSRMVEASRNPLLKSVTPEVGKLLGESEIQGLPLVGADPLALITTLPGYRANPRDSGRSKGKGVNSALAATVVPVDPRLLVTLDSPPNRVPQPSLPTNEAYEHLADNPFVTVAQSPLATFTENDHVTIVTYAGNTAVALRPTTGDQKNKIINAIDGLVANGSTNGGAGIQLAYDNAVLNYIEGGVNRVILATDGDFNVGVTNPNDLLNLIEQKAKSGVFLTALGVGMGNYKDSTLEKLADKGNGNFAYLDSLNEARKVLVEELGGTLVTVAKDVKIQVEFNPALVTAYRLIGYENRALRAQDFADDRKDAGDMGAGQTVTALFEVVPQGAGYDAFVADGLRYQAAAKPAPTKPNKSDKPVSKELLNLRIRYKEPNGAESKLIEFPTNDRDASFSSASSDFRFAAAVASFGMVLRNSPYKGSATLHNAIRAATDSKGPDKQGYREEFIRLVDKAIHLGLR